MKNVLLVCFFLCSFFSALRGEPCGSRSDPLGISGDQVYVVSTFDEADFFTCYDRSGALLWEHRFISKIKSWKREGDLLLIFSKGRVRPGYFLTCVDPVTGKFVWGNEIFAPTQPQKEP